MSKEVKKIEVSMWPIDKIKPYELNSKKHDKEQVKGIAKSIKEFGWDQPIVVDGDGVVIKGHGRRLAAIELGLAVVPVVVRADLSPEAVRAARLADNRVAIGDIDTELLQTELMDLDYDLTGIFDDKELNFMTADLGELNEGVFVSDLEESVREQSDEAVAKIAETDDRPVPVYKALGFRNISGRDERYVVGFMALIEKQFGLEPEKAFVAYAKQMVSAGK